MQIKFGQDENIFQMLDEEKKPFFQQQQQKKPPKICFSEFDSISNQA